MVIDDCILNNVEQRWFDSWNLWISCAKNYFEPESFRLNLNNCIQTLRSLTWLLQKRKSNITGFDEWYKIWQEKMKADQTLRWLTESRNRIVKEGDLSLYSKANVAIITNWFEPPSVETEINPFTKTEDLVKEISNKIIFKPSYLDAILRIERKWVDSQLPETELLEALSYVFKFITMLLVDVHESLLEEKYIKKCSWYNIYNDCKNRVHRSMDEFIWYRTSWYDLKEKRFINIQEKTVNKKLPSTKKIKERYGSFQLIREKLQEAKDLDKETKAYFELAKYVLKRDGHHSPMVIIGYPDKSKKIIALKFDNKTEKYLAIYKIADILKNTEAVSIIFISESWLHLANEIEYTKNGYNSPNKQEVLSVSALNIKGEQVHYAAIFEKKDDEIIIKEDSQKKFSNFNDFMFLPIKKVWGIK
jgi:hypothetical protein